MSDASYGGAPSARLTALLSGGDSAGSGHITLRTVAALSPLPSDCGSEEEEEHVDVSEADVLAALEAEEPAWVTVQRLFKDVQPSSPQSAWSEVIESLTARGWASVPADALPPPATITELRTVALALHAGGGMTDASATAAPGTRSDRTVFVSASAPLAGTQGAVAWLTAARDKIASAVTLTDTVECQLAVYTGGSHYGRHRDALPDDGASGRACRRVTAVLYGQAEWEGGAGGALRLWPPTGDGDGVDLAPVGAVVFLSGAVDHCVLPVATPADTARVAMTMWMW